MAEGCRLLPVLTDRPPVGIVRGQKGEHMKQTYCEQFVIKSLRDDYGLGTAFDSIEDAREAIDIANEGAASQGYSRLRFIICNQKAMKVREDCGKFVMSTVVTVAVETYPQEL